MSKFDEARKKYGIQSRGTGSSSSSSPSKSTKPASKFDSIRMDMGIIEDTRPKTTKKEEKKPTASLPKSTTSTPGASIMRTTPANKGVEAIKDLAAASERTFPSAKVAKTPTISKLSGNTQTEMKYTPQSGDPFDRRMDQLLQQTQGQLGNRLGTAVHYGIERPLAKLGDVTKPATDIFMQYGYTPGAGLGAINAGTQAIAGMIAKAPSVLAKLSPKVGELATRAAYSQRALPSIARTAAQEAVVGAPIGAGQVLTSNPSASGKEVLKGAGLGAAYGAGLGGAFTGAGKLVESVGEAATKRILGNQLRNTDAIEQVGREGMQVDNAVSKLADIDEQISSLSARGNVGGSYGDELQTLLNDRSQTVDYIKRNDPEFTEPPVPNAPASAEIPFIPNRQANTASTPPTRGIRANYKNQLDNGNFSPELQQRIRDTDQTYDIVHNVDAVAEANKRVSDLPRAEANFIAAEAVDDNHIATGYRLMQELDALREHERAFNIADKLAKDLTKIGQSMQAAKIISRLSPEGQLVHLARVAAKNNNPVTVADQIKFKELAAEVQDNLGSGIRANKLNQILDNLEQGKMVPKEDLKQLENLLERASKYVKKNAPKDKTPKELKDTQTRDKVIKFFDDIEKEALERIKARGTRLNSLPIREISDHAIVAAAQIAKGTIKAASYVDDLVRLFGENIRPYADEVYAKAQKMLNSSARRIGKGKLDSARDAVNRISGRQVPLQEKIVDKYIKENPVRPEDITKLRELARQVTQLSGDNAAKAEMAMQKILNSYEKANTWDRIQALRYIAMLLNTHTQMINAISGPIMATTGTVADIFGTMIDITLSKALKQPRTTTLYGTNPLGFVANWFKNAKIGGKAGWEGVNPSGIAGPNEIRGLTFKSLYNPLGIAERSLGTVAKGADYGTYKSVQQSEMKRIAYLDAVNNGVKGKQNIKRHIEDFMNNPPDKAILQADRIGKNTTFQRNDTLGGSVANYLNNAEGKAKLLKPVIGTLVPFVRTPINIASTAVTLTPGGIIKGLFQLTSKSDASRREAIRTMSLGLTGTGLSALGYYLSQIGIITGANDSGNKNVDAIREQAGQGKYRFNTSALMRYLHAMLQGKGADAAAKAAQYQEGDSQFDYNKLQPLAFPLAIGAGLENKKEGSVTDQLAGAGTDAFGSLYGMSTLKGVQDAFQPQYGGTIGEKALGVPSRMLTSFLKSFSPSALAQEARRQDPFQRKASYNDGILEDTTSYFKSRTPGLSQSLPPNKTTLGKTKENAKGTAGSYLNPYRSEKAPYNEAAAIVSKLIDSTGNEKLAPSAPAKKVSGKDRQGNQVSIEIPPDRYTRYQEELGKEITNRIVAIPQGLSDQQKADRILKIYETTEEKYRNQIKRELGLRPSR